MIGNVGNEKPKEAERLAFTPTDNEKLIEEALAAYWGGAMNAHVHGSVAGMRAAFAVFEKALTPTDDEREALVKRLEDEVEYRVRTAVALHKGGHDHEEQVRQGRASVRFLVAGFRRSEVPEPSAATDARGKYTDAQVDAASREIDLRGFHIPPMAVRAALRAASGVTEQGENRDE